MRRCMRFRFTRYSEALACMAPHPTFVTWLTFAWQPGNLALQELRTYTYIRSTGALGWLKTRWGKSSADREGANSPCSAGLLQVVSRTARGRPQLMILAKSISLVVRCCYLLPRRIEQRRAMLLLSFRFGCAVIRSCRDSRRNLPNQAHA